MTHIIHLPRPISTNTLFRNVKGKGRVKTKKYEAWLKEAWAMIAPQKDFKVISSPVRLLFAIGEVGISPNMDGDNALKGYIDALVANSILLDDRRSIVKAIGMEWVPQKEGTTVYITPFSATTAVEAPLIGSIR